MKSEENLLMYESISSHQLLYMYSAWTIATDTAFDWRKNSHFFHAGTGFGLIESNLMVGYY